jgi:ankyrin repeat protein
LHEAAIAGHKDVVELLLSKGADVRLEDKDRYTALDRAAELGAMDVAASLFLRYAELGVPGDFGSTLCLAAEGGHEDIIGLLLFGCSELAQTHLAWVALHKARKRGYKDVVQLMWRMGVRA